MNKFLIGFTHQRMRESFIAIDKFSFNWRCKQLIEIFFIIQRFLTDSKEHDLL